MAKLNLIEDLGKGLKINNENWSGEKIEESDDSIAPEESDTAAKTASNKEE
jgi:hypothetical protein